MKDSKVSTNAVLRPRAPARPRTTTYRSHDLRFHLLFTPPRTRPAGAGNLDPGTALVVVRPPRQARARGPRWKRCPSTSRSVLPVRPERVDRRIPRAVSDTAALARHLERPKRQAA